MTTGKEIDEDGHGRNTATGAGSIFTAPLIPAILLGAALLLIAYNVFVQPIGAFPGDWNLHLREPLDAFKKWVVGNRATSPVFVYFFEPISALVDFDHPGVRPSCCGCPGRSSW